MFSPQARYIQGHQLRLDYTNPSSSNVISAGTVLIIGAYVALVLVDIQPLQMGAVAVTGVFDIVKDASVWNDRGDVFWNPTGNPVGGAAGSGAGTSSPANGNLWIGYVDNQSGSLTGDATVRVVVGMHRNSGSVQSQIADPGNAGAIPAAGSGYVPIVTAGAETRTIAAPTSIGQKLLLDFVTKVGNCVVTVASTINAAGNNTITMSAAGQSILLSGVLSGANYRWAVDYNDGTSLSTV